MAINWTNVTGPSDLMALPNYTTGGWFWMAMNFMVFFIMTALLMGFGIERAIITSSLISLIMAVILVYMNLVAWTWCLFFLGVLIFTFIYIIWAKQD